MAYYAIYLSWFLLLRSMPLRPVRSTKRASLSLNWHTWSKTMAGTNTLHTLTQSLMFFTPHSSGKTHHTSSSSPHTVLLCSCPVLQYMHIEPLCILLCNVPYLYICTITRSYCIIFSLLCSCCFFCLLVSIPCHVVTAPLSNTPLV